MYIKAKDMINSIKENDDYYKDFMTRSVYNSNAIEGNTLSYYETYAMIFNEPRVKITATPREIYEVINLKYAMSYMMESLGKPLSLEYIQNLGIFVNRGVHEIDGFRSVQVYITGTSFIPASPDDVMRLMYDLVYEKQKKDEESIFDYLARFHMEFEHIHPFIDGNGRVGRLLINHELLSKGYPPAIIPIEKRDGYMELLDSYDIKGLSCMLKDLYTEEQARMDRFDVHL